MLIKNYFTHIINLGTVLRKKLSLLPFSHKISNISESGYRSELILVSQKFYILCNTKCQDATLVIQCTSSLQIQTCNAIKAP